MRYAGSVQRSQMTARVDFSGEFSRSTRTRPRYPDGKTDCTHFPRDCGALRCCAYNPRTPDRAE